MEKLHTKSFVSWFIVIAVLVILIGCRILMWNEMRIEEIDIDAIPMLTSEDGIQLYIDYAYYEVDEIKGKRLDIGGWCIQIGNSANSIAMHVLIKDSNTGKVYKLPTSVVMRTDVTAHFADGYNYDKSGFRVKIEGNQFSFQNTAYEVLVLYEINGTEYVVHSGNVITQKLEEN